MSKKFFIMIGLVLGINAQAQVDFGPRYEVPQRLDNNAYLVIPAGETGLLLAWTDYAPQQSVAILSLQFLNKDLKPQWSENLEMPNRYLLKGFRYVDNLIYLLLESTTLDEVKVYRIDPISGRMERFLSTEIEEFVITEFEVVRNTAIIGGYVGDRPAVFSYDFRLNKLKALLKVFNNYSMLVEIKVDQNQQNFHVLTTSSTENADQTILVNIYRYDGTPVTSYRVETEPDYQLISGAISSFWEEGQLIVGLYGHKGTHPISGIYINHVDTIGNQKITYHNLGELPQFFDYLGEKDATREREKTAKLKAAGKESLYKLSAAPRPLIEENGQLVFTGEFFRSHIQAANRNSVFYAGLPNQNLNNMYGHYGTMMLPGDVIRPNVIHQAYALVLNRDGSIAWDDFQKLERRSVTNSRNNKISPYLKAVGSFLWQEGAGTYTFYENEKLHLKTFSENERAEMVEMPLKLKDEDDNIAFEKIASLSTLDWYDNHIVVHGIQHIRPADRSKPLRRVFFVNKVSVGSAEVHSQENE